MLEDIVQSIHETVLDGSQLNFCLRDHFLFQIGQSFRLKNIFQIIPFSQLIT